MFRRILLWFGGMLLFSFAAYVATTAWIISRVPMRDNFSRGVGDFQHRKFKDDIKTGAAD